MAPAGLKVFKNLGMFVKGADGKRVATDDPRLDPIWARCGELGIPVLIHVGEPMPFWQPWDRFNERWLELKQFPNRRRDSLVLLAVGQGGGAPRPGRACSGDRERGRG